MDVLPRIARQLMELSPRDDTPATGGIDRGAVRDIDRVCAGWYSKSKARVCNRFRSENCSPRTSSQPREQALVAAGLTGFEREGQRILAPESDLDRYNAALLELDALPADLGSQMLKQYETLGPFSTPTANDSR